MHYLKRQDIQLAYPFSERRLFNQGRFSLTWAPPYLVQPKLDGERCRAIVQSGRALLLSSTAEIIPSVPHINQALLHLPDGEYDGELYTHGWTFSEIHSVVSTRRGLHPLHGKLEYHIFDVITGEPQLLRVGQLMDLKLHTPLRRVPTFACDSLSKVMSYYDQFISEGYEGFIIRHVDGKYVRRRTPAMMKFKPKKTDVYQIIHIHEATSEDGIPLGMVGAFECIDEMGTKFKVGAGKLTHPERKRIWRMYLENILPPDPMLLIEYQTLSDKNKVPHFSRAVKVIGDESS